MPRKPKLCLRAVTDALDPQHEYLSHDDDFLDAARIAIERGMVDPVEAVAFARGWRASFLANLPRSPDAPQPDVAAIEEARKEGATAERARIQAILNLPEAEGREASAKHLAFSTAVSPETAKGTLAGLSAAQSLRSLPPDTLRACHSPTGLLVYDEARGGAALPEPATRGGASLLFSPHNPADEAKKADPKYHAKTAWRKVVGDLNATQTDQSK